MMVLPLLTGSLKDAKRLIAASDLPTELAADEVHIDASSTLSGTPSFAQELIRVLVVERHANRIVVEDIGASLGHQFVKAARQLSVQDRLIVHVGTFELI